MPGPKGGAPKAVRNKKVLDKRHPKSFKIHQVFGIDDHHNGTKIAPYWQSLNNKVFPPARWIEEHILLWYHASGGANLAPYGAELSNVMKILSNVFGASLFRIPPNVFGSNEFRPQLES